MVLKKKKKTWYTLKHEFAINGKYFDNKQKFANLVSFTIVIFSGNEETILLSRVLYSKLIGDTITFSVN